MNNYSDKIAITTGDPNGIGAEITIKALKKLDLPADKILLVSNRKVLDFYGKLDKNYEIIEIPFNSEINAGMVTKEGGEFSFQALKKVCAMHPKAIVTAPVAKNALHLAGHIFNGQTEILEHYLSHDGQKAEMFFVAGNFKVLLLTRHCALKEVTISKDFVANKILNLKKFFKEHYQIQNPKFALCGFNPHSGEDGILGREEIEILHPVVAELRKLGVDISDPLPADTLFVKAAKDYLSKAQQPTYDCYIANYHDQGLIPIKTVAGDSTVNMTIGLDIIRTSPGHGTAFDIAGKNIADENGMIAAIKEVL